MEYKTLSNNCILYNHGTIIVQYCTKENMVYNTLILSYTVLVLFTNEMYCIQYTHLKLL